MTLCRPVGLQGSCCTDLSYGPNAPDASYGIFNGSIRSDIITNKVLTAYTFFGQPINCCKYMEHTMLVIVPKATFMSFSANIHLHTSWKCALGVWFLFEAQFKAKQVKLKHVLVSLFVCSYFMSTSSRQIQHRQVIFFFFYASHWLLTSPHTTVVKLHVIECTNSGYK